MKKIIEISPFIVAAIIIICLLVLTLTGQFDPQKETTLTTSALTEMVKTATLSTAEHIQHGIAKVFIEGKGDGYILYYAIVKPTVNFSDIEFEIDHDTKTVIAKLPKQFSYDVELLEDDQHKFRFYPYDKDVFTAKDIEYSCEIDAINKAKNNKELNVVARQSLESTVEMLLDPIISINEYSLVLE